MPLKLTRRSVLKGLAGVALPLPLLEAMGQTAAEETPKRFCGLYIANGMALPRQVAAFCGEHSQTGTNLARSYLLAIRRLDGVPREIADLCGEHSQTEASSARNYSLAIALGPSLRLTLLGAYLGQRLL